MSLTPNGKAKSMQGQMVRPVFGTDLSGLVKLSQAVPQQRPTIEQDEVSMGVEGDAGGPEAAQQPQRPSSPASIPQGQGSPSPQAGAQPPAQIDKPQPGQNPGQQHQQVDPEQAKQQAKAKVLQLREKVRQFLNDQGLHFEMDTKADSLVATVHILPHVQAEDDEQFYPADQVMNPIVQKMLEMGFDVKEPTPAQAHRRVIDPSAKPVTYTFSYSVQKQEQKQESQGGYSIPRAPQGGTPIRQSKPNSKMGEMPAQKAASDFSTVGEMITARKDDLVNALKVILAQSKEGTK